MVERRDEDRVAELEGSFYNDDRSNKYIERSLPYPHLRTNEQHRHVPPFHPQAQGEVPGPPMLGGDGQPAGAQDQGGAGHLRRLISADVPAPAELRVESD